MKAPPPEALDLDEIRRIYDGEWVGVRVTSHNEYHDASEGEVVAHGSHARVWKIVGKLIEQEVKKEPPRTEYYVFLGGPVSYDGSLLKNPSAEAIAFWESLDRRSR